MVKNKNPSITSIEPVDMGKKAEDKGVQNDTESN